MSEVNTEDLKNLRKMSGAGMLDCKKALIEAKGDIETAVESLRKKGLAKAVRRLDKETGAGRVFSYIHGEGNIGVLLQLHCETDFVARNEEFAKLGHELSMQVAASNPLAISPSELDPELIEKEKSVYREQLLKEGKKEEMIEKITEGKVKKFYSEVCLSHQTYIRDNTKTIDTLLKEHIAKFGENITISRFSRYQVG